MIIKAEDRFEISGLGTVFTYRPTIEEREQLEIGMKATVFYRDDPTPIKGEIRGIEQFMKPMYPPKLGDNVGVLFRIEDEV